MKNCKTIIFSKNRAFQLHLTLSTLFNHCSDALEVGDIVVLYRNDPVHEYSYHILMSEFPQVVFKREENFKKDLLSLLPHESNILLGKNDNFVTFIVDDQVFVRDFSMKEVVSTLAENSDSLGFSLRLGKNCTRCFPYNREQNIPEMLPVSHSGIVKFNWEIAEYDFNYPLELSASSYRIKDIFEILKFCTYSSPNTLEDCMASSLIEGKPMLLCYMKSPSFSIPLNRVQETHPNRSANFNPDTFRLMYEKGIRFKVDQFDGYVSKGAHEVPENLEVVGRDEN